MSRRLLVQAVLLLMVAVPAIAWLTTGSDENDYPGGEAAEAAPDFTLELFDGRSFTLGAHLNRDGRPVVMNFWASWCVPCRVEMPAFDAVARQHPEVLVLGVGIQDTEPAARAFADEIAVTYPLGLDADGAIIGRYPILGLPTTWFITSEGVIAARWSGQLDETLLESMIEEHLTG